MTIGDRIRIARESTGMTQEELGAACGTTKQTVYKYETGIITNIPMDKIEAMAAVLHIKPPYLMGWDEKETPAITDEGREDDMKLLAAINALPPDRKEALLRFLGIE